MIQFFSGRVDKPKADALLCTGYDVSNSGRGLGCLDFFAFCLAGFRIGGALAVVGFLCFATGFSHGTVLGRVRLLAEQQTIFQLWVKAMAKSGIPAWHWPKNSGKPRKNIDIRFPRKPPPNSPSMRSTV